MYFDHYRSYSTEDFILDENFIKLARGYSVEGTTLEQLKNHFPEKKEEIAIATKFVNGLRTIKRDLPDERKAVLLSLILKRQRDQFQLRFFIYAAAAMMIIALGVSSLYLFNIKTDIENFASSTNVQFKKAELILADGKRIEIDSKQSKIEYSANGANVSLNDTLKLEQSEPVSGESFNQVIVPFGKRSTILLSDGSRVWLNSGSRLVYPAEFKNKTRDVFLEGEAYFEVSKNQNKPFFVRSDAFRIKVLGTKFLVQANKNELEQYAVLVEGRISLAKNEKFFSKECVLLPNQKVSLSNNEDGFSISEVEDIQKYISWIYGYQNFENKDLSGLTKMISRYYNVEIEVKTNNVNSKFSGKLDLKESPEKILDGLSIIFKTKYEKQEDKFVFYE